LDDLREISRRVGRATETMGWLATRLRTAELLQVHGQDKEALAASSAAVELTRRFGAASSLGWVLRIHGRLTGDEALLAEAADRLRDTPTRLEHARALIDLGASMRRRGARRARAAARRA
jgi:hypothetical protein